VYIIVITSNIITCFFISLGKLLSLMIYQ